jgi:hypothetical protein
MRSEHPDHGRTHIAKGVTAALTTSLLLVSCGSVQRAYWDARVEEMCRKDGGVTVYERVKISPDEYKKLGGNGGTIVVRPRSTASADAPYVAESKDTWLNENPPVLRSETFIVRRSDGKVLSRLVRYARIGEEIFRPYGCREAGVQMDVSRQTFDISGE